jgi:hypothetical protein
MNPMQAIINEMVATSEAAQFFVLQYLNKEITLTDLDFELQRLQSTTTRGLMNRHPKKASA